MTIDELFFCFISHSKRMDDLSENFCYIEPLQNRKNSRGAAGKQWRPMCSNSTGKKYYQFNPLTLNKRHNFTFIFNI